MAHPWILWIIILGYMVFIFFKGVSKVNKIESADDFLVAGRSIGWFALACTMGATVIGGGASIGAIARTYEWGVLMLLVSSGVYVHFIFAGLVVAPHFRKAEVYTVAGYFGHRFGEGPRFFTLILSLLFSVFIIAAQMAAFGSVMSAVLPQFADVEVVLRLAIIIGGSMVVIYSTAGGLLAVIHTDVYQFIILLLGFFITLAFCVPDIFTSYNAEQGQFVPTRFGAMDIQDAPLLAAALTDENNPISRHILETTAMTPPEISAGERKPKPKIRKLVTLLNTALDDTTLYTPERFARVTLSEQTRALLAKDRDRVRIRRLNLSLVQDAYREAIAPNRTIPATFFHPHGGKGWIFLVTTFCAFLLGEAFAPGYATRYCVGRNIQETRYGIAGVGLFLALVFPAVLLFIALYARIHFPDIEPQQALPMVVKQLNNPIIGGLIIGALLMAVMSSADSALNSATAIFVKDLFEHQLGWRDTGDGRLLKLARLCSGILGGTAILVAILWSDIIGLLLFTYHVWAPAIILPVCIGTLSRRRSQRLNRIITASMVIATVGTLLYRAPPMLRNYFDLVLFNADVYAQLESFDPAVFGVLLSIATYTLLKAGGRLVYGKDAPGTGQDIVRT